MCVSGNWSLKTSVSKIITSGNILLQVTLYFTFPGKSNDADSSQDGISAVSAVSETNHVNHMPEGLSLVTHV